MQHRGKRYRIPCIGSANHRKQEEDIQPEAQCIEKNENTTAHKLTDYPHKITKFSGCLLQCDMTM